MRTLPPPSIVTTPPPSMTVSMPVGSSRVWVTVMVAAVEPQANVTTPPLVRAADRAASVHDDAVPVPTTVVGLLTSAAWIGAVHTAAGGETAPPSTSGGGVLASPAAPLGGGVLASPSAPPGGGVLASPPEDPQPAAIAIKTAGARTTARPMLSMDADA